MYVAPCTGAWIETFYRVRYTIYIKSLPVRERGLKRAAKLVEDIIVKVAPCTGAWIETSNCPLSKTVMLYESIALVTHVSFT